MIKHRKGDMFEQVQQDSILVHACNTQGRWGSGIAVEFRNRFPSAHESYKEICYEHTGGSLIGRALLTEQVRCLFTSEKYEKYKASESVKK